MKNDGQTTAELFVAALAAAEETLGVFGDTSIEVLRDGLRKLLKQ